MPVSKFVERHSLRQLPADDRFVPYELGSQSGNDSCRYFVNSERTIGLGLNDTKDEIRVVYAELGLADTGWIPRAQALSVTGFTGTSPGQHENSGDLDKES